jgi:hypothetical protein
MAFQSFEMTDLSIDGLGEFAIEGFEAAVRGQFAMRLGRFAIGGIPFGGIDGLNRLAASLDSGKDIDPTSVVPSIGFLELADLDVQTPDIDRLSLARIRLDTSDYVGLVPSATTFEMSGLVVPTNAITDRQARALMERFGYEKIDLNFFAEAAWKPAGQVLTVKDLRFSLKDMGGMAMNFAVGGFPLPALQDDKALQAALPGMTFLNGELTFQDESIIGNGLDMLAEQMHARPDAFRQQFADAIPFFLSMATANDPQLLALIQRSGLLPKLIPVVRDFVAVPGSSITFSAKPLTPVGVMAIAQAAESAPSTLADLLGLTITGKRGEVAPPPEEENKVEPPPPAPPTQSPGAAQQPAQ